MTITVPSSYATFGISDAGMSRHSASNAPASSRYASPTSHVEDAALRVALRTWI
jgi:hypothetical protein